MVVVRRSSFARERSNLTTRIRAVAALGRQETVETQVRGTNHLFPGRIVIDYRAGALQTASEWRKRHTVWTEGSRIECGEVGASCLAVNQCTNRAKFNHIRTFSARVRIGREAKKYLKCQYLVIR